MAPARSTAELVVRLRKTGRVALALSNRLRLPGPAVLPVAGTLVGLYSGLAAGLFSNLIAFFSALFFAVPRALELGSAAPGLARDLEAGFAHTSWHLEYLIVGVPIAASALGISRLISPGDPEREQVKARLRVLALLLLGALGLYYPLVALGTVNRSLGASEGLLSRLDTFPLVIRALLPALGGYSVGRLLQRRPEVHGHGVPEVVMSLRGQRKTLSARGGVLKLVASAITIGSGGSAGREGPIVYGGAAFASSVGRTLGFSRRELGILMASGAGAGIAASFDVPIAGALFALEILLRDFELGVLSPIILASVSATMVNRGVVGMAFKVARFGYGMVSGWELLAYGLLGLACGLIAYAFVRLLHGTEAFFQGRMPGTLSPRLGRLPLHWRAAVGGLCVGALSLFSPAVWGTGHEALNFANAGRLGFWVLAQSALLKLVATSLTIGSGGSGGTFFPAIVMGAMTGGTFGTALHHFFPAVTAPAGAYAMVGMGGAVAGFTRGPLTGMMIVYELSGDGAILLPLMVTATIASALCHWLVERRAPRVLTETDQLREVRVRALAVAMEPVHASLHLRPLVDRVLETAAGAVPVLGADGALYGVVQLSELSEVWKDDALVTMLTANDVAQQVAAVSADASLEAALDQMNRADLDALPVVDTDRTPPFGLITRAQIRRFIASVRTVAHAEGIEPVAPTEVPR